MAQANIQEQKNEKRGVHKHADTPYDLHPLIAKRWSPRAFSDRPVDEAIVKEMVSAARWSASSMNEQPWEYVYAMRGTKGFESLWNCLSPGNQPWAKDAAFLMVMMVRRTFARNGRPNPWAEHDLGLANAQLLLQAAHRDVYGHLMAGFNPEMVSELLSLEQEVKPVCMGAFGYLGDPEILQEPYYSREQAPRKRKPLDEILKAL